jgi:hypothetical protein
MNKESKILYTDNEDKPLNRTVLRKDGTNWNEIWFCDIKKDNEIKLRDPDGTTVTHEDGREVFIAKSNAYLDGLGFLCFDI